MISICRIVDDDCFPYIAASNKCKIRRTDTLASAGCKLPTKVRRNQLYRVGPAYSLNNETDIMIEIMESGPVQGIFFLLHLTIVSQLKISSFFLSLLSNNASLSRLFRIQRGSVQTLSSQSIRWRWLSFSSIGWLGRRTWRIRNDEILGKIWSRKASVAITTFIHSRSLPTAGVLGGVKTVSSGYWEVRMNVKSKTMC